MKGINVRGIDKETGCPDEITEESNEMNKLYKEKNFKESKEKSKRRWKNEK